MHCRNIMQTQTRQLYTFAEAKLKTGQVTSTNFHFLTDKYTHKSDLTDT